MMTENELTNEHTLDLRSINQQSLESLKSDISKVDEIIVAGIENVIRNWLENQKSKRLYNAINDVLNPAYTPFLIGESSDLFELLTAIYSRISNPNVSEVINLYDHQFDFSKTQLKQALFTILKYRCEPPNFDEIIDDLQTFNFQAKAEHHRESVRTMLRYYNAKKNYIEVDKNERWSLTISGEKFYTVGIEPEIENKEFAKIETVTEGRDATGKFVGKFNSGGVPIAKYYADSIKESGKNKLHAREIAKSFNAKYNQNVTAHDVGNTLRKNSKVKNAIVIAYGNNFFGLVEKSLNQSEKESINS